MELMERVPDVVSAIKQKEKPYVRVTRTSIGRELGYLDWIQHYPTRLPKTMVAIDSAIEDVGKFQRRRIATVIGRRVAERETVIPWRILREANIPYRCWQQYLPQRGVPESFPHH